MSDPTRTAEFPPPIGPGIATLADGDVVAESDPADSRPSQSEPGQSEPDRPESGRAGRGWWRRNRVALAVILILAPLTGLVIFGDGLRMSRSRRPTDPITVEAGQTASYSGATVGPTVAVFTDDFSDAPGRRVLRVTTTIANGTELFCDDPVLRELTGAKREWKTTNEPIATDPSDVLHCDFTRTAPYDLQSFYVIPDDAVGPFAVELYDPGRLPNYVKLVVNPTADG